MDNDHVGVLVWVVSFRPATGEGGVGGFDWFEDVDRSLDRYVELKRKSAQDEYIRWVPLVVPTIVFYDDEGEVDKGAVTKFLDENLNFIEAELPAVREYRTRVQPLKGYSTPKNRQEILVHLKMNHGIEEIMPGYKKVSTTTLMEIHNDDHSESDDGAYPPFTDRPRHFHEEYEDMENNYLDTVKALSIDVCGCGYTTEEREIELDVYNDGQSRYRWTCPECRFTHTSFNDLEITLGVLTATINEHDHVLRRT